MHVLTFSYIKLTTGLSEKETPHRPSQMKEKTCQKVFKLFRKVRSKDQT